MDRRLRGFTLIELLVVIAIIAILAAILFPVFVRAKDKAKETSCKSNMKQIAMAYQRYTDDWNGAFPDQSSLASLIANYDTDYAKDFVYGGPGSYGTYPMGYHWIQCYSHRYMTGSDGSPISNTATGGMVGGLALVLKPYVPNLGVFKCPAEWRTEWRKPDGSPATDNDDQYLKYGVRSGYYVKHHLCYYANEAMHPVMQSQVKFPKKVTLMYEQQWHYTEGRPYLWDIENCDASKTPPFKRINAIFFDLHIGTIDVPFQARGKGYDPNWYFYAGTDRNHDLETGARDVP